MFSHGNGMLLYEIRDMIQNDSNTKISNKEVKQFLNKIFGDSIQFCYPERKNESLLVYPSEINVEDVINTLGNTDIVSEAAKMIPDTLKNHTFNLDNKFCDADDLKHSWYQTQIPDDIVGFFSTLFKIPKMPMLRYYYESDDDLDNSDATDNNYDSIPFKIAKIGSMFQILYYNVNNVHEKNSPSFNECNRNL